MQNSFNSNNELWTEIALSSGWVEVLGGADNLTVGEAARLEAIKAFGVANSYWKAWMAPYFLLKLKEMFAKEPGTSD